MKNIEFNKKIPFVYEDGNTYYFELKLIKVPNDGWPGEFYLYIYKKINCFLFKIYEEIGHENMKFMSEFLDFSDFNKIIRKHIIVNPKLKIKGFDGYFGNLEKKPQILRDNKLNEILK